MAYPIRKLALRNSPGSISDDRYVCYKGVIVAGRPAAYALKDTARKEQGRLIIRTPRSRKDRRLQEQFANAQTAVGVDSIKVGDAIVAEMCCTVRKFTSWDIVQQVNMPNAKPIARNVIQICLISAFPLEQGVLQPLIYL